MMIIFCTEFETPRMKEDLDCPESAIQLVPFGLSPLIKGLCHIFCAEEYEKERINTVKSKGQALGVLFEELLYF